MTLSGSGVGGNIGGPQQPSSFELETTASTQMDRAALGIVADSIEQSFTQLNSRYNPGYLGGFGYKATGNRPMLDHPLESVRVLQSFASIKDESWYSSYEELISQLPLELQGRLKANNNALFEERNPLLMALDNVLIMTSKIMTQSIALAQPEIPGSIEENRAIMNLLLPFAALKNSVRVGNEAGEAALKLVVNQGPNHRYFDSFNNVLGGMQKAIYTMQKVNSQLAETKGWELNPETKQLAASAAHQFSTLANQLKQVSLGDDLQILLPLLQTLATVSLSLSLPSTGSAPLFLALSNATMSSQTTESATGFIGPDINLLLNGSTNGILATLMPNSSPANQQLLNRGVIAAVTSLIGLTGLTINPGIGTYPAQYANVGSYFAFEAALSMTLGSSTMETIFKELIAASGGNELAQDIGSVGLSQLTHMLIIMIAAEQSKQSTAELAASREEYLKQAIVASEELANTIKSDNLDQETAKISVALTQAHVALDQKNYEAFLDSFNTVLESLGGSRTGILSDLVNISNNAQAIARTKSDSEQLTSIVHVV